MKLIIGLVTKIMFGNTPLKNAQMPSVYRIEDAVSIIPFLLSALARVSRVLINHKGFAKHVEVVPDKKVHKAICFVSRFFILYLDVRKFFQNL